MSQLALLRMHPNNKPSFPYKCRLLFERVCSSTVNLNCSTFLVTVLPLASFHMAFSSTIGVKHAKNLKGEESWKEMGKWASDH